MSMKPSFLCLTAIVVAIVAVLVAASSGRFFTSRCQCKDGDQPNFSGVVEDCCCDYGTVNTLNSKVLYPLLQDLVRTPFFRYYKAKLWCDCPFWPDDGMCILRDCSVCECPEDEFPEPFKSTRTLRSLDDLICQEGKPQAVVDRTLDTQAFTWKSRDNPWTADDERDEEDVTYVNLLLNPERYTGYKGPSARRIWDAIYNDNVVIPLDKTGPPESRVLYKLISGLHSSISVHIAAEYLLDEMQNKWGVNETLLYERVTNHPDRVQNLYFTYLLVLRAVTKASAYLKQAEYNTQNPRDDERTAQLVMKLVENERLQAVCPMPFDEAKLWQGANGSQFLQQLQKQFRNISSLMDCVGCEKCRLWGKLQVLGLGTALEILFSEDSVNPPMLQRNEVIALINLLNRLSESLHFLQKFILAKGEPNFVRS